VSLTQTRLKQVLFYNKRTGGFIWLVNLGSRAKKYHKAGTKMKDGRIVIRVDRVLYYAHQLAWLYVYGVWPNQLDHRDTINCHNWINNLREASRAQNTMNTNVRADNKTGYRGVHFNTKNRNFNAYITINNTRKHLGVFNTAYEAHLVYEAHATLLFGEYKKEVVHV